MTYMSYIMTWVAAMFYIALPYTVVGLAVLFYIGLIVYSKELNDIREFMDEPKKDDLFPDTLYQAVYKGRSVCFGCGVNKANSVLRTITKEIAPICGACSFRWSFYGYAILKEVRPKALMKNVVLYKLKNFFSTSSCFRLGINLWRFKVWGDNNMKFLKKDSV